MHLRKPIQTGLCAIGMLALFSCQKDVSRQSAAQELSAHSKAGGGGGSQSGPPPAYVFTIPTFATACVTDGSYCFEPSFTNKGGNAPGGNNSITVSLWKEGVQVGSNQVVNGTFGNVCFNFADINADQSLVPGQYTVLVYFRHAGSDNAQPVNVPLSFSLTIQSSGNCGGEIPDCTADGVRLTRSVSNVETDISGIVTSLQTNYTVANCGTADLTKLKLQGGLINKATIIGEPFPTSGGNIISYKKSTSNGNNILTWLFNLPAGATETFSVYYSVSRIACGSPLSGAWSLKNSAGVPIGVAPEDMSATQAGYLDRLYWNCQ